MARKSVANPIVNELKGSAWFRHPVEADSPPQSQPFNTAAKDREESTKNRSTERRVPMTVPVDRTDRSSVPTVQPYAPVDRTDRSTVQQPENTRTLRRAYDLYPRQLTGLRRIRATRELSRDAHVSLSELVREAVDLLLTKEGIQ